MVFLYLYSPHMFYFICVVAYIEFPINTFEQHNCYSVDRFRRNIKKNIYIYIWNKGGMQFICKKIEPQC